MPQKTKNILYLVNSFDTGGAEKAMVRLCSNLDRDIYNIICVVLNKGDSTLIKDLKDNNIKYKHFNISKRNSVFGNLNEISKLYRFLKSKSGSILVCSLFHSTFLGRTLGRLAGIKKIINWEHNEDFGGLFRKLLISITMPLSNVILMDSKAVHKRFVSSFPFTKKSKIMTIPIGGIDLKDYCHKKTNQKKIIISSVGKLHYQKGYDLLITIAHDIIKKFPNVIFQIAGDGPEKKKLMTMIKHFGISKNFILLGFTTNVPSVLYTSDIYVQPSRWEGLCITVVEAAASSLPIVAFDVGGINETVKHNTNGFLVDSVIDLRVALERLIVDKRLRIDFGSKSRSMAEKKFDIDTMIDKFEKVIVSLFNGS